MRSRCCSFASSLFAKNQPSRCPQLRHLFSSGLNGSSCYHGIHTSSKVPPGMLIWTKKMVDALENYKEIHGDLLVKKRFRVPDIGDGVEIDPRWDKSNLGLPLGRYLQNFKSQYGKTEFRLARADNVELQELIQRLHALGFRSSKRDEQVKTLRKALQVYKSMYGDVNVTKTFECPRNSRKWPEETWGMKLGSTVANIRNRGNYPELKQEMRAMGMDYNPFMDTRAGPLILTAVLRFKELYGHFKIPLLFKVPEEFEKPAVRKSKVPPVFEMDNLDKSFPVKWPVKPIMDLPYDAWPEEVRGMKLGFKFASIYYDKTGSEVKPVLEKMGAFLNMEAPPSIYSRSAAYGLVLLALKEFKANYGHLDVPEFFVIPTSSNNGMETTISDMTATTDSGAKYKRDDSTVSVSRGRRDSRKEPKILYLSKSQPTDMGSPSHIVPTEDKREAVIKWSSKLEGYRLGQRVGYLRFKAKFLAKNRTELEQIGFDWQPVTKQVRTKRS